MRLQNEIAIVTGSTRGLGKEVARMFAAEGAKVVVSGRDLERGQAVVDMIRDAGNDADFFPTDISDYSSCRALVAHAVSRYGGLTILVNNAVIGAGSDGPLADVPIEEWEEKVRVNIGAIAVLSQAAIPHMQHAGHGSIVNVSSRVAERGTPRLSAYTASKGAMNALTRSIAVDYVKDNIRCNSVTPGYIINEVRDAQLDEDPVKLARVSGQHLTRLATATDVAYSVLFLASHESDTITGIDLPCSGGSTTARGLTFG